jgi:hypothetical protein
MKKGLKIVGVVLLVLLLIGMLGNLFDKKGKGKNIVFDIPKIIELPIDSVISNIGKPTEVDTLTKLQIQSNIDKSYKFQKGNLELDLDVSPQNGEILRGQLFLKNLDGSGSIQILDNKGIDSLTENCNLKLLSEQWWFEPIKNIEGKNIGLVVRTVKEQKEIDKRNEKK